MSISAKTKNFFVGLSRESKRYLMLSADSAVFFITAIFVSWVLYGARFTESQYILIGGTALVTTIAVSWLQGLYDTVVRYIGLEYFHRANTTAIISAAAIATAAIPMGIDIPPIKWGVAYWTAIVLYLCYSRYLLRSILASGKSLAEREQVVIYGAGSAGSQLVHCMQSAGQTFPVAFLDDDESLHGKTVRGVRVYSSYFLEEIMREQGVSRVLLAMPSASMRRRREIVESLEVYPVHVQTIPDFRDLVSGKAQVDDIREVNLADLMGRPLVPSNPALLHACIEGKTVLVTGAGGSIGSELCRQILKLDVNRLLLMDICEPSLYRIEKELNNLRESANLDCQIVGLLGNVGDCDRVEEILDTYAVQTIYHAAAYKHVPIVEANFLDGIRNNALGTFELANAACKAKVESFVLISTDKAVRPTSVMGATKRVAELVLQALQEKCESTRFCMVRFGNVLESSGSVVPLFREQIRSGGPVTVTHRDIVRYFMTIQEAAELVIQAGSMAEGGDVFVLDMGEPVEIFELARRMIMLTGMTVRDESNPDGDIEIVFTGLRPGEKLYEELLVGVDVSGTEHPRIMRAVEKFIPFADFQGVFQRLSNTVKARDCDQARKGLLDLVDNYSPTSGIDDLIWKNKNSVIKQVVNDNVTEISTRIGNN